MQKVNLFETERMFTDIYCLEPGQEQKRHAHYGADKIYLVIEGTGRFHLGDDERDRDGACRCRARSSERIARSACGAGLHGSEPEQELDEQFKALDSSFVDSHGVQALACSPTAGDSNTKTG